MNICQIVPSLIPGRDGLGDYGFRLASALRQHGINSTFLVAGHQYRHQQHGLTEGREVFRSLKLDKSEPASLTELLNSIQADIVMVHMSGYGYESKGSPRWLAQGLARYKQSSTAAIIVVFHELWQKPVLWRKTAIRWFPQYRVIRRLFELSDAFVTNALVRFEKLHSWDQTKPGLYLPVFSNVGELSGLEPKEKDLAVIFGLALGRGRTYEALASKAPELAQLGITKIVEIGDPTGEVPISLRDLVVARGQLDESNLSKLLARAKYGLTCYDAEFFAKSGVFNAFAAHGVCTINLSQPKLGSDGLEDGKHYLSWQRAMQTSSRIDPVVSIISENVFRWYGDHRVESAVSKLISLIKKISPL